MAVARYDAKCAESEIKKINEQIHYIGQYLSTKSTYGEFLKASDKRSFRNVHSDELDRYKEARQNMKQYFSAGNIPSIKELRVKKNLLMRMSVARYETFHYFKDRNAELQTVLANVDSILETAKVQQRERQPRAKKRSYDMSL